MDEGEINSITSEMLERIQQNSGCSFVSRLVTLRERAKWHTAVLIGDDLPTAIAESLASSQDAEVGLLIFPTITAPPQVADLLNSFPTSRWKILDADEGGRAQN